MDPISYFSLVPFPLTTPCNNIPIS